MPVAHFRVSERTPLAYSGSRPETYATHKPTLILAASRSGIMSFTGIGTPAGGAPPVGASLAAKQEFAASMIAEEQSFGQSKLFSEGTFGDLPCTDYTRRFAAGDILRGMLIRMDWYHRATGDNCNAWILRMLAVFGCFRRDWNSIQEELGTMIGRSFTSLNNVYDIICIKGQLGRINSSSLQELINQPRSDWKADMNMDRPKEYYGSGTFKCWLPENVSSSITNQGFDDAAEKLSEMFFRLELTERHYCKFFDISEDDFNSDIQRGERGVHDWVRDS
ncbi:hypothetical protein V493_06992 [Pseudogymnoascus sp. VKM F-4281 (FW-2241)]|nr:hypothetical protein V493_06992 [Pseudogymnoascus sp. VKM F-4281 (FW-2241)]